MTDYKDPMIPDGKVNPIDTDYQVGQDNILVKVAPLVWIYITECF